MKLFRVSFRDFDSVYVEAASLSMAADKAEKYRKFDKKVNGILAEDGSIRKEDHDRVEEVSIVSDFVVR